MSQNVPIPASTARKLAQSALEEAEVQRQKGLTYNTRAIRSAVEEAMTIDTDKNGEYVSLSASTVSTLACFGDLSAGEVADVYLKQYDIWG